MGQLLQSSITAQLRLNARTHPDRPAIQVLGGPELSYAEAWRRVVAIAALLADVPEHRGIRPVGLLLPNGADAALAYVACQLAGCTGVPVNSRLAPAEMAWILGDSGASLVLTGGSLKAAAGGLGVTTTDLDQVATPAAVADAEPGIDGRRPLLVGYTSGTTGLPKGGLYSGDGLYLQYLRWGWQFGLTAGDTLLTPGPQFHNSYGGLSLLSLMAGATNRVMPAFDPAAARRELTERATWVFLVPSMLAAVLEDWRRDRVPIGAVRFVLSSGAPISRQLLVEALDALPRAAVAEAYGWSEGGWVTFEVKDPDRLVDTCVGWPMTGADVRLVGDDDEPAASGETGEIVVRNLTPFLGYLGNPAATATADWRGYHRSGDVGRWLPDGRLCVVDRKKDMIITGGENVYSAEVERVLASCPGVVEAAVIGRPSPRWGEEVTAVVVPDPGGPATAQAVQDHCRRHLAGYKVPKRVEVVDALPRNAMGKVQKFLLRDQAGAPAP